MRADRLVAILLMSQAKRKVTAAEVAEELEPVEVRDRLRTLGQELAVRYSNP